MALSIFVSVLVILCNCYGMFLESTSRLKGKNQCLESLAPESRDNFNNLMEQSLYSRTRTVDSY